MRRPLLLSAVFIAFLTFPAAAQKRVAALDGFDAYVERAILQWQVPGLAIVVVKNGAVVHSGGYGVRTLGSAEPVDANTLFAVGSTTKAFTAALVGMLVDEGKLRWDDPVTRLLPGFEMYDPYVTRELTVRDLLSHRSGLSRGDLTWYGADIGRDEIVNRVRHMRPTWGLRSRFGYQNIMYLTAGQVVSSVTDSSWDDLIRQRLLAPLGMSRTTLSVREIKGRENVATPHAMLDDKPSAISYRNIDNIGPAGSLNSTVNDYAKWIRFQLDSGRVGGKALISARALAETHAPHTVIRYEGLSRRLNPYTHLQAYGLGWFIQDFRGRQLVQHGGNIDGMTALVALMPEEQLGLAIFSNMNATGVNVALMYALLERFVLGYQSKDWSAEALRARRDADRATREQERRREAQRVAGTSPALPLNKYVGAYYDSLFGEMRVTMQNGRLVARRGDFVGDLEHWHYETFRATWRDRTLGKSWLTFALGADGAPTELVAELSETIRLTRINRPAAVLAPVVVAEEEARRLLGVFASASPSIELRVEWVQGAMTANVPGASPYTLVAAGENTFRISGPDIPEGSYLSISMEDGRVRQVVLQRPDRERVTLIPRQ